MLIISVTCLLSSRVCELDLHNGEMWVGDCLEPSCYNLICSALGCVYMTRHLRTYLLISFTACFTRFTTTGKCSFHPPP